MDRENGKQTPIKHGKVLMARTPTPFKKALADLRKQGTSGKYEPSTPNKLVEDITELINDESTAGERGLSKSNVDSLYETDLSRVSHSTTLKERNGDEDENMKENEVPGRKVRKALGNAWEVVELPFSAETPVIVL